MVVVDDDATLELQVKTVKYFKSIEAVAKECSFHQTMPKEFLKMSPKHSQAALRDEKPTTNSGLKPTTNGEPVQRAVTPDLVLDKMSSRMKSPTPGQQSEQEELQMQNMHSRMPVRAF
jgi:glucosamine-6-phosphate deaminase